jgi:hypothetical protein
MDRLMYVLYKYLSFKKRYHDSFSVEINHIIEKFVGFLTSDASVLYGQYTNMAAPTDLLNQ